MDKRTFDQWVVILLTVTALVVGILYGHILSNQYLAFGVPILLAGFMMIGNMKFLWCFLVMISGSNLAAGNTTLYSVLAFAYSGAGLLVVLMHKGDGTPMRSSHLFLLGFLAVSIFVAMVRGIGLRALGSSLWGGSKYFTLWGGIGLCLISNKLHITKKYLIRAIVVMLIVASFPGFLRYVNEIMGGRLNRLGYFIRGVGIDLTDIGGNADSKRLEGVQASGGALILLSLALITWQRRTTLKIMAILFLGFMTLGLAGYRATMIFGLLTIGIYYHLMKHDIPRNIKKAAVILGLTTALSLVFLVPYLPFAFQRMLAWVPGIDISEAAYVSAQGTSDWRVEMWLKCLPMLKEYWLIGRGLAYELSGAYSAYILTSDATTRHEFFIATHQYHNGPLYLLLDYGVLGAICGTGFMLSTARAHWKLHNREWSDIRLKNLHAVFLAHFLAAIFMFFVIFGALNVLMVMLLNATLMAMLCKVEFSRGPVKGMPSSSAIDFKNSTER